MELDHVDQWVKLDISCDWSVWDTYRRLVDLHKPVP
jgi:hypothetical protein